MSAPEYKTAPTPTAKGEENAIAVELSNGHVHYLREVDCEFVKECITEPRVNSFKRHFQNESEPIEVIWINCAHIVSFYPVDAPEDSQKT